MIKWESHLTGFGEYGGTGLFMASFVTPAPPSSVVLCLCRGHGLEMIACYEVPSKEYEPKQHLDGVLLISTKWLPKESGGEQDSHPWLHRKCVYPPLPPYIRQQIFIFCRQRSRARIRCTL